MKRLLPILLAILSISMVSAEDMKMYYINSNGWSKVYAYVWNDMRDLVYWPGSAMTLESSAKCTKGDVYSFTFPSVYTNLIFNNDDGMQTTDMPVDPTKPYYYRGQWYASLAAVNKVEDAPVEPVYYLIGEFNNWSLNTAVPFKKAGSAYTVRVPELKGEFKVLTDRSWMTNYGAPEPTEEGAKIENMLSAKKVFTMELNGENMILPQGKYTDIVMQLTVEDEYTAYLTFEGKAVTTAVSMEQDKTYYLIGDFNEWKVETAVPFKDKDGVLSLSMNTLNGSFKIIQGKAWTVNYGAAESHVTVSKGTKLQMSKGGKNLSFDVKSNGIVTMELIPGEAPTLIIK